MESYLRSKPRESGRTKGVVAPETEASYTNRLIENSISTRHQLLVLSTASQNAATKLVSNTEEYLCRNAESQGSTTVQDLAYTLSSHRSTLPWRFAFTAETTAELINEIQGNNRKPQLRATNPRIGFVFTGQGAQLAGMARELTMSYPVFEQSVSKADEHLRSLGASWSITGMFMAVS